MNGDWRTFLETQGAVIERGRVIRYGASPQRTASGAAGCVMADLSHWGIIAARGEEAATFLQGQLTGDIHAVTDNKGQISGYCNPKGRLLATFYVFRHADAYCLCLPAELVGPLISRLNKFKLRARLELQDMDGTWVRVGLAGGACGPLLETAVGAAPAADFDARQRSSVTAVRLPGPGSRVLIVGEPVDMRGLWSGAHGRAVPVGAASWESLEIQAGVPMIHEATQERFIPQMVNLDALGGISFKKGCYTGQEIVARTHYLGRLKQRMYLAQADGDAAAPGDLLYSPDADTQYSSGTVVAAQPLPGGGQALLAVISIEAARRGNIHLHAADGPELYLKTMPYDIEGASADGDG